MKRQPSWLARKIAFFFQFKLTPVGRMAVFLMFLSAIGIITTEIPIYQIFCGIVALFGVAEICGAMVRPRLTITGSLPEKMTAGDTALGLLTVENRGFLPVFDICCGCFILPSGVQHIAPDTTVRMIRRGKSATLPVQLRANQRGEFLLSDVYVHSTFPLNIMRTGATPVPPHKLSVVPAFHSLEELDIPISHRYQHGGILLDSHSGNAAEYVGNRDYIPGEPTKRLDFRAWARVGKPIVREYQDEFCSRVAIVLDTYVSKTPLFKRQIATNELEAAISLTAAVADSLDRIGTTIELFAAGPDLFFFQSGDASQTFLESILEILAAVDPTNVNPFDKLTPAIGESLESISVIVCVFLDWDESREELVNRIIQSGCALRVLLVRDRPPTRPFPLDEYYSHFQSRQVLQGEVCTL
ncbi:DUF58 domain-containing protein [Planctomicrobium sp. SH661]|uniref:DUF58 domain-containing protein n=1 Tax=Planctomicrobium sp. SH661 TaxID=3448124 RepID=UPI003F5B2770